jgi:hypothetical protein
MLYNKLELAIKYKIRPDDIKLLVEEKPLIDTVNDVEKRALMMADMVIDDKSTIKAGELKTAMRVIYWKMNNKELQNKIVGLAWMNNGLIHLFEGHILSPE